MKIFRYNRAEFLSMAGENYRNAIKSKPYLYMTELVDCYQDLVNEELANIVEIATQVNFQSKVLTK